MNLLRHLSTSLFVRNVLDTFGLVKPYSNQPGGFSPYFHYIIGPNDNQAYHLCFKKEPFAVRYKNEIFNKLCRFTVNDGRQYLEYHLQRCPYPQQFFDFLFDELSERLARYFPQKHRIKLLQALAWVVEKRNAIAQQEQTRSDLPVLWNDNSYEEKAAMSQELRAFLIAFKLILENFNQQAQSNPLNPNALLNSLRPLLEELIGSYMAGKIEIEQPGQLKKVIQHLYLLRILDSKKKNEKKGESLFKKFGTKDLASIARLHFTGYRNKELNTVQKDIGDIERDVNLQDPKMAKLYKAMQDFYFGK